MNKAASTKHLWALLWVLVALACWAAGCDDDEQAVAPGTTTSEGGSSAGGGGSAAGTGGQGGSEKKADGEACVAGEECLSGHCVDDVCCGSACDAVCQACNLAGSEGSCANVASGADPDDDCAGGVCDGAGHCATGGHEWGHLFGDSQSQLGAAVAVDGQGNAVIAGFFRGAMDLGGGVGGAGGRSDVRGV